MALPLRGTVIERFVQFAGREPACPIVSFLGDNGREEAALTAHQLLTRASGVAAYLRGAAGLHAGDRVALAYPPSLDFVVGLVGSMLAGLVPVPVAPPDPLDASRHLPRFTAMLMSAGATAVLSNRQYVRARRLGRARDTVVGLLRRERAGWPELPWYETDSLQPVDRVTVAEAPDVALLQYTSGSTSQPRGVMITQGNLLHQLACNAEDLGLGPASRTVFWVPHFHDFGLISGILSALYGNGSATMLSPLTFLRRPAAWIEALSQRRATHTAAPDFAYDLVTKKTTAAQRARWDLRALTVAMSAAEPIRDDVVRTFCDAFAPAGFDPAAFCPAYGLAEHTVGVSVGGSGRVRVQREALERAQRLVPADGIAAGTRVLVGCGRPSRGVTVRVVDPSTGVPTPTGVVGELWVDSPSKAAGYWGLPEESRETFQARLPDDPTEYLRTGDLGAVLDGEVYITGRLKDLIILRGRNIYPSDVETTLRGAHPSVRPGGVAAFSVEAEGAGGERLVAFVEAREPNPSRALAEEIAASVRRRLTADDALFCHVVVVSGPGLLQKTTSGKVRRSACRQSFLAGALPSGAHVLHREAPPEALPEALPEAPPAEPALEAPAIEAADPRTEGLAPSFTSLLQNAMQYLTRPSVDGGEKRPAGVGARGWLRVVESEGVPAHPFFRPGARWPVLLRHDNRTARDDAAPDARVASLRVLDPQDGTALDRSLLDLVLLTGRCFFHRTAEDFFRFSVSRPEARAALLRAEPHRRDAAWEGVRLGDSYRQFHYHSQTASRFVATDGSRWFARYRLRDPEAACDTGAIDPADAIFPEPDAPRRPDDARSATCLRDEFSAALGRGPVAYLLEVQLVPATDDGADRERLLDSTRPWPEADAPWRPLAALELTEALAPEDLAALEFNPGNAPASLGVHLARTERDSASIDHVRTILYEVAARTRRGLPISPAIAALLHGRPTAPRPATRSVAVIGAGASGLTLARALEQRGYTVTVFERAEALGGMCRTLQIDGLVCDLGGHMIFPRAYPTIVALAREFGQELVPDFPDCTVSLDTGEVLSREETPQTREAKHRAARIITRAGTLEPGSHAIDRSLAVPIAEWIEREDLGALWTWMGPIFVGAGYGYLADAVPATYLARSFRHTMDQEGRFQLRDGFQSLWERVAESLRDVRARCEVTAVVRSEAGVTLTARHTRADGTTLDVTERFDDVVIAHAPVGVPAYLDATEDERALLARVRCLPYVSAYVEVEGVPDSLRQRWCFVPANTDDASRKGQVLAFILPGATSNVAAVIAYEPPEGMGGIDARYAKDFARLGARLVRVIEANRWSYFPHFGADDLRDGSLDRLEALQGTHRTWYASTLLSFELTECAAAYGTHLAQRMASAHGLGHAAARSVPREALAARAPRAPAASPPEAFEAFRATVAEEVDRVVVYLQGLFVEAFEGELTAIDPTTDLATVGIDSLRAASLHARISEDSGLDLEPAILYQVGSLRTLAELLVGKSALRVSRAHLPGVVAPAETPKDSTDDATEALLARLATGDGEARGALRSTEVEVDGQRFHIVSGGHGAPVVFLHGFPEFWYGWRAQLRSFARTHRVFAVDLPGFNRSPRPAQHALARIADLLARLLPTLVGGERVTLVGHDIGAMVAWELAARHGARVAALVVLNGPPFAAFARELAASPAQQRASEYIRTFRSTPGIEAALATDGFAQLAAWSFGTARDPGHLSPVDRQAYATAWSRPGALAAMLDYYRALDLSGATTTPEPVRVPTLIVWGDDDPYLLPGCLDGLDAYVASADLLRLVRIPGATHWLHHEEPERLDTLLREFLRDVAPGEAASTPPVDPPRRSAPPSAARNLSALQPAGSQRPFFCVHPLAGDVLCYAALASSLGNDQPFYVLESNGRWRTDPELDADLETMAARYADAVRAVQPRGPYLLGGWSFGGLLAFEMARIFEQAGEPVGLLAMMDTIIPSEWPTRLEKLPGEGHSEEIDLMLRFGRLSGLALSVEHLPGQSLDRQLEDLVQQLVDGGALPRGAGLPDVTPLLAVARWHLNLVRSYRPSRYNGRVTMLRATDELWDPAQYDRVPSAADLGWSRHAPEVIVHRVPGDHGSMLRPPYVDAVAAVLANELAAVRA